MTTRVSPSVYVIAGPNGAGKTTFATRFLPRFVRCNQFLNADLIAAGLAPFAPETQASRAGRRRFAAGLRHFFALHIPTVTIWYLYDGSRMPPLW